MHAESAHAFAHLNRRFRPGLMAYFVRRLGNRSCAEDMASRVLARMAETGVGPGQPAGACIFRIAASLLKQQEQGGNVRRERQPAASVADVDSNSPDAPRMNASHRSIAAVVAALRDLPEREWVAFILCRLENVDRCDLAEVFDVSPEALDRSLRRVMAHIARAVGTAEGRLASEEAMACGDDPSHGELLEQAADWCLRWAEGRLTREAHVALESWLTQAPSHLAAMGEVIRAWQVLEQTHLSTEAIAMRRSALAAFRPEYATQWMRNGRRPWIWPAITAACVTATVSGVVWLDMPTRHQTGIDESRTIVLADGSELSLAAQSRVDVRLSSGRRELWLRKGRATFQAAHDPLRPFAVNAAGKLVVGGGSVFAVELLANQANVVLYEGGVDVLSVNEDGVVDLVRRSASRANEQDGNPTAFTPAVTAATLQPVQMDSEAGSYVLRSAP